MHPPAEGDCFVSKCKATSGDSQEGFRGGAFIKWKQGPVNLNSICHDCGHVHGLIWSGKNRVSCTNVHLKQIEGGKKKVTFLEWQEGHS